jgi:farnesyl-diphosphate farnesyltransferase
MLTEIFVESAPLLKDVREQLRGNARWFGEGLQLVNILKDSDEDRQDGRIFVPQTATRVALFQLAREDLHKAEDYVRTLKVSEAPAGVVAFTELPLLLAWRTLECVEQFGPGSKVPRSEVLSVLAEALGTAAADNSQTRSEKAPAK